MNSESQNLERIRKALEQHDSNCPYKVLEIQMSEYEADRLDWESYPWKGRDIPIVGLDTMPTGRFNLLCEGQHKPEGDDETVEAITKDRELQPA
jgi:hypothetical protein